MTTTLSLNPIGTVHAEGDRFYLQINAETRPALQHLNEFSHVHVLFWAHQLDAAEAHTLVCKKPYRKGPDTIGVFATRAEMRPNPILMTIVPILSVDEESGIVELAYIDALEGSPLLDIKPYIPCADRVASCEVGTWASHWPAHYEESATFDWSEEFNF